MKNDIRVKYSYTYEKWFVTMQGKVLEQFDDLDNAKAYKAELQHAERVKRATANMYNQDLLADLEKIKALDPPVEVCIELRPKFGVMPYKCYVIRISEHRYFYSSKRFRDYDYKRLKRVAPQLNFLN